LHRFDIGLATSKHYNIELINFFNLHRALDLLQRIVNCLLDVSALLRSV
jgi:hypothetical protein